MGNMLEWLFSINVWWVIGKWILEENWGNGNGKKEKIIFSITRHNRITLGSQEHVSEEIYLK